MAGGTELDERAHAVIERILDLALDADASQPEVLVAGLRTVEMLLETRLVSPGGGRSSAPDTAAVVPQRVVVRVPARAALDATEVHDRCAAVADRIGREFGFRPDDPLVETVEDDEQDVEVCFDELHVASAAADLDSIADALHRVLEARLPELLTRDSAADLLGRARRTSPVVVQELVPNLLGLGQLRLVLCHLLTERVPIRRMTTILECLADTAVYTKETHALAEHARRALRDTIVARVRSGGDPIEVAELLPRSESTLLHAIQLNETGQVLVLEAPAEHALVAAVRRAQGDGCDALVTADRLRRHLAALLHRHDVDVVVLARSELGPAVATRVVATIELDTYDQPGTGGDVEGSGWLVDGGAE